jgi:predicted nucleic-acid-binding protein
MKNNIIICDTNVILRHLLNDDPNNSKAADELFALIQTGEKKAIILESVFTECIFVLTKVYNVPREQIARVLTDLFQYKGIINDDKEQLLNALDMFATNSLHIVDCVLIAKSIQDGLKLFTFDKELEKYYLTKKI